MRRIGRSSAALLQGGGGPKARPGDDGRAFRWWARPPPAPEQVEPFRPPAGFMEYGETPERCARRELLEETGVRARLTGLFGVYAGHDDPRVRSVLILYTAERVGGRLVPGDDAIAAKFFPLARLPRAIAFASHRAALAELDGRKT